MPVALLDAPTEALVDRAEELLRGRTVAVLTGAGVSTDSGIPDYRGEGAPARSPMTFQTFVEDERARRRYWAGSHLGWRHFSSAEPNAGHRVDYVFVEPGIKPEAVFPGQISAAVSTGVRNGLRSCLAAPRRTSFVHVNVTEKDGTVRRYAVEWGGAGQLGGQGVNSQTLKVGDKVIITGSPAALSTALTRAARSWCRSRSHCDVFKWRMAVVAAAQIAGGNAVVKMKPGA